MNTADLIPYRQVLALMLATCCVPQVHADATYVIVRHAEKPAQGLGQLSCQGLNRSLALPTVLLKKFGTPKAVYAPNPSIEKEDKGIPYAYVRPLSTIEPTAIQFGLPVGLRWGFKQIDQLTQDLKRQSDGTYFIAWEHHLGALLARNLVGASKDDARIVPNWDDDDFDSIYVVRLVSHPSGLREVHFEHDHQGLNGLSTSCPTH